MRRKNILLCACLLTLLCVQTATAAQLLHLQLVTTGVSASLPSAVKLGANGNPVIAYNRSGNVALVRCGDPLCSAGNIDNVIPSAGSSSYLSLQLDANDNPVISYFYTNSFDLRLIHCGNPTCTSGNVINTIDSVGTVGLYNSLQLDSNGNPVISYHDSLNDDLKLVHCGDPNCTSSGNIITTVDFVDFVGAYTALALDGNGNPVISYFTQTGGNLKLVHCANPTCTGANVFTVVDSVGNTGIDTALALNSAGHPVISYYDTSTGDLRLAYCGDANCITRTLTTVDASSTQVGLTTALALASNGNPQITYSDATNRTLRLVRCGNPTCSANNSYTVLDTFPAPNGFIYSSLVLDANDHSYVSYTNGALKLARLIDDALAPTAQPSQSPATNPAGWNNSVVTVAWNWRDNSGGVGIDTAHCPATSVTSGEGAQSLQATCQDLLSNIGTASYLAQVDLSAPIITADASQADGRAYTAGTWSNQVITVRFTCSDAVSPVASCPGEQTITADGISAPLTGLAMDSAGNSASVSFGPIQIDTIQPVIVSSRTPAANSAGWNNGDVTVSFICSDPGNGAGVGSDTLTGATLSDEGENQSVTNGGVCEDLAGNRADPVTVAAISIDKTAPTLQPSVMPNPVLVGGSASVTAGAIDLLSGIADESCGPLDTSSAGVKSVTCNATDRAGNNATVTIDYTVTPNNNDYGWSGFFSPINNPPAINTVNAGAAAPIKFGLGGDFGLDILVNGSPTSQQIICGSAGTPSPGASEEATISTSGLHFDPTTNSYSYVWKSDKAWANTCRRLLLRLNDGSEQIALFQFTGRNRSAGDDQESFELYLPLLVR